MKYPAEYEAIWSGDKVYCCEKHLLQIRAIGAALGMNVPAYPVDGEKECSNCVNEAKKKDA